MSEPSIARVIPDVSGLDKTFDYLVPDGLDVPLGALVRIPLHGRRVGGWVVRLDAPQGEVPPEKLKPIAKVTGRGPARDLLVLIRWASTRWGAGRVRPFLVAASPPHAIRGVPPPRRSSVPVPQPVHRGAADVLASGGGVLQLPPAADPLPVVLAACALGPALVVVPSVDGAKVLAARLRRADRVVALHPDDWASAAGGVDVVIGARGATWAPCAAMAVCVLLDEHDEALQEERTPTWHARDVLAERARRAGVPFLAVSPAPTVTAAMLLGEPHVPDRSGEREGWPVVEIVDRSKEEHRSLVTASLIRHLRDPQRTVVCVTNTPGRARLLACKSCRTIQRCEACGAAVGQADDGRLACARCGTERPGVCQQCGATAFANLRPGVTRLREELEAAANRPVVAITGQSLDVPAGGVYVGTEAVLHRVHHADVVAFLDFDAELLAPRYRAAEQAMALVVRACRLLGDRQSGGRLLIQTSVPRHEVVQAALLADPSRLARVELERREALGFPPFAALAQVSGPGADEFAAALRSAGTVQVAGPSDESYLVRAPDWQVLGETLSATPRPQASRLRIEVDPPRI